MAQAGAAAPAVNSRGARAAAKLSQGYGRGDAGAALLRLRQRLERALTALVVALVTANGGSEQMAGTTATTEAGKLRETTALTRVSLGKGNMK